MCTYMCGGNRCNLNQNKLPFPEKVGVYVHTSVIWGYRCSDGTFIIRKAPESQVSLET